MSDENDETKPGVIDLAKKRLKKEISKKSKPSKAESFKLFAKCMARQGGWPADFPSLFKVAKTGDGSIILAINEKTNEATRADEGLVVRTVLKYVSDNLSYLDRQFHYDVKAASDFVKFWVATYELIDEPFGVAFQNGLELCYKRLPWNRPSELTAPPLFAEILSRMSNAQSFALFVGSLFFDNSDRQTYLWLHGKGDDGKGALTRLLHKCFGHYSKSLRIPNAADRFWTQGLLGTKLGVFADVNDQRFITTGLFKSLSGGDDIPMEIKGGASFSAPISTRFIFVSNMRPSLGYGTADMRRAIFCEMKSKTCPMDPTYETRLWAEAEQIVGYCLYWYEAFYHENKGHAALPIEKETLEDIQAESSEKEETVFHSSFQLCDKSHVTTSEMQEVVNHHFPQAWEKDKFKKFIENRFGLRNRPHRIDGQVMRAYRGIKKKPGVFIRVTDSNNHGNEVSD